MNLGLVTKNMLKKYKNFSIFSGLTLLLPHFTLAVTTVNKLASKFTKWMNLLIPILIGLGLLYFIWNVISLIRSEDEGKREEAKKGMWWGIVAMFVIVSIWGIISFVGGSLEIDQGGTFVPPKF